MRKYIFGIITVLMFALCTTTYAEEVTNMVGHAVQGVFSVQIDGKKLEKDAIVIDGTTYFPVRSFGEAIGYDVSFDPEMGVLMNKKVDHAKQEALENAKIERERRKTDYKIQIAKDGIQRNKKRIEEFERDLKVLQPSNEEHAKEIEINKQEIEKAKAEIQRLEKELAELEAQ